MHNIYLRHKHFWTRENVMLLIQGIIFFVMALIIQHFAYQYIDNRAQVTPVGDLLLNNLPTLQLDFFIVQGALISSAIAILVFILHPRYIFFSIKTIALFIIIRSFFISLTHLGVNLHQLTLNTHSIGYGLYDFLYNGKNDFFFSGHVGATFLLALIFWKEKIWRFTFLAISVIFGISLIFAHMHYSIDIFAAPFITYSIFVIAKKLFSKDYQLTK